MGEGHVEHEQARLLDQFWPHAVRLLEDIQILILTQPRVARAIVQSVTAAREACAASRSVVVADTQQLAVEVQYWEDRYQRAKANRMLATVTGAKPAKVRASSPHLALVPKRGH